MDKKEENVKRGPGQPKKDPSIIVGIRVPVAMAAEFKTKATEMLVKMKTAARKAKNK